MLQDLHTFIRKSKSFQTKDWNGFFKTYWPTFDSFALGAASVKYLKIQLTWPTFIESAEWQTKGEIVYDLLKRCLEALPPIGTIASRRLLLLKPKVSC
jgi:hypothetical protein